MGATSSVEKSAVNIILVAHHTRPEAAHLIRSAHTWLQKHGHNLWMPPEDAKVHGLTDISSDRSAQDADLLISLGGDGTILKTARTFGARVRPLAALNTGRLGFLTTAAEAQFEEFLDVLVRGAYTLSQRRMLEVTFSTRQGGALTINALNEITLTRGRQPRMILVEARIDGDLLNRYRGDGLIVSTPTGSTAYSLSAGGPLVSPKARVFVVTPICSHTLSDLAVVVDDSARLELIPLGDDEETLLTVDGDGSIAVPIGAPIHLRRAPYDLPLIHLPGHSFYSLVRTKLGWSGATV